jgi:hypothetical protein
MRPLTDPSSSHLAVMRLDHQLSPSLRMLTLGVKVPDLTDIPFHRKAIRALLWNSSGTLQSVKHPMINLQELEYVFVDGYNIGSESLKYHTTEFIKSFRNAFQRPGHRVEGFNRDYPNLSSVRIVIKREMMGEIGKDEMAAFREVVNEIEVIGEGTPKIWLDLRTGGPGPGSTVDEAR